MANLPPPTTPPPAPDVAALGLVALHALAQQGNRAARTELERRMRVLPAARQGQAHVAAPVAPQSGPEPPDAARTANAHAERLQLMAQLAPERDSSGPPRLVGLVLLAWDLLLGLGGLTLLIQHGNAYYVFCGLACVAVGLLLTRCSPWAMHAHLGLAALALAWGWHDGGSLLAALAGALPLLAPLLWIAMPAVREPLS